MIRARPSHCSSSNDAVFVEPRTVTILVSRALSPMSLVAALILHLSFRRTAKCMQPNRIGTRNLLKTSAKCTRIHAPALHCTTSNLSATDTTSTQLQDLNSFRVRVNRSSLSRTNTHDIYSHSGARKITPIETAKLLVKYEK